ncbi:MAG: hypothetical protein QG614_308 [Patescibacteria group bacterium]|nr:hypothetical protein [Patescibacteria group bacterium]
MQTFNFKRNNDSKELYVILSGIDGGLDDLLVKRISEKLENSNNILTISFGLDLTKLTFNDIFNSLNNSLAEVYENIKINNINFIGHSFSALTVIYFVDRYFSMLKGKNIKLILLDRSFSRQIVDYMKTDQKDIILDSNLLKYLEENNEENIIQKLKEKDVKLKIIEADEIGTDHNFSNEKDVDNILKSS